MRAPEPSHSEVLAAMRAVVRVALIIVAAVKTGVKTRRGRLASVSGYPGFLADAEIYGKENNHEEKNQSGP